MYVSVTVVISGVTLKSALTPFVSGFVSVHTSISVPSFEYCAHTSTAPASPSTRLIMLAFALKLLPLSK